MNRTIALLAALPFLAGSAFAASGEIHATTIADCTAKVNVFGAKADVYVAGSGLTDGSYYVRVTNPGGGEVLGTSAGAVLVVSGGTFACAQVIGLVGVFADTPNPAPNYTVEVSLNSTFPSNATEKDNFKVIVGDIDPPSADLTVNKFYDANANGINDDAQPIAGWEVRIQAGQIDLIRYTPVTNTLDPDTYTVSESAPVESNWIRTTPSPVIVTLADGDDTTVEFGNVCTGQGGGKSHGYWGNRNGQAQINDLGSSASEMALLTSYNLKTAAGGDFDPTTYDQFKTWNGSANAVNMAYMLSVQMSANILAIEAGLVNPAQLVYAPGLIAHAPIAGLSATGFISVANLIIAANSELGLHGSAFAGAPHRAYQEALKNVLDKLANNQSFVQATPCPFTFPVL